MKKQIGLTAFTLVELIIVVIVIGLLATLALPRYNCQLEKARRAEAYNILGSIRDDAKVYEVEHGSLDRFVIDPSLPGGACDPGHYFTYGGLDINGRSVTATRCDAGGKLPNYPENYTIDINLDTGVLTPHGPSCAGAQGGGGGGGAVGGGAGELIGAAMPGAVDGGDGDGGGAPPGDAVPAPPPGGGGGAPPGDAEPAPPPP